MDQIFSGIGDAVTGFFSNAAVQLVIQAIAVYLIILWLAGAYWAFRDMQQRSENPILPYVAASFVILFTPIFFPLAIFVYKIVRPHEKIGETYERNLAEEALLAEVEAIKSCPTCARRVNEEWIICPTCRTRLNRVCPNCSRLVGLDWSLCAWCGKDFERPASALAASTGGRPAPITPLPAADDPTRLGRAAGPGIRGPGAQDRHGPNERPQPRVRPAHGGAGRPAGGMTGPDRGESAPEPSPSAPDASVPEPNGPTPPPDGALEPVPGAPASPADGGSSPPAPPGATRPGLGTFTIEGRAAPGLFVVGWLATLLGLGIVFVGGAGSVGLLVYFVGPLFLATGLIAGAGNQAIERRAHGEAYAGPSPYLVFAAMIAATYAIGFPVGLVLARGARHGYPRVRGPAAGRRAPGARVRRRRPPDGRRDERPVVAGDGLAASGRIDPRPTSRRARCSPCR